jgi:hypothetical protein
MMTRTIFSRDLWPLLFSSNGWPMDGRMDGVMDVALVIVDSVSIEIA